MRKLGLSDESQATLENFSGLFDGYVNHINGGVSASNVQHYYMANVYVDLIAEGIQEFDVQNHNNPDISMDHYRALAWDGLKGHPTDTAKQTKAWKSLSLEQKNKIKNDRQYLILDCACTRLSCN